MPDFDTLNEIKTKALNALLPVCIEVGRLAEKIEKESATEAEAIEFDGKRVLMRRLQAEYESARQAMIDAGYPPD